MSIYLQLLTIMSTVKEILELTKGIVKKKDSEIKKKEAENLFFQDHAERRITASRLIAVMLFSAWSWEGLQPHDSQES